jgi:transposase
MPPSAVLLFEDEFIIRLFPVLRRAWSRSGEQATVGISGRNAKRLVFGAINIVTGHRILLPYRNLKQENFQDFLRALRRSYPGRQIWLLLDEAGAHTAIKSQKLAEDLNIKLVWLPTQCPELNAMDHFWRQVKADVSTNYQYADIDQHVATAINYMKTLKKIKALDRAGILSKTFWLKRYSCKIFCKLT